MSSNTLKIIALIAMVFDHVGLLIPGMPVQLRWIGRIAAPIFLFCFVWSIDYTHDKKKFAVRVYGFNCIMCCMDLFYNLLNAGDSELIDINFFGTLFALYLLIYVICNRKANKKLMTRYVIGQMISTLACTLVCFMPNGDAYCYFVAGISGNIFFNEGRLFIIVLGCILYFFKEDKFRCAILYSMVIGINSLIILTEIIPKIYWHINNFILDIVYCRIFGTIGYDVVLFEPTNFLTNEFEWMAVFALPFILTYNGKKGRANKYFYYIFYPCHIAVLLLVRSI